MIKLFARIELKEVPNDNLYGRLHSYMESRNWRHSITGSNGMTMQLPRWTYQESFDDDVDCLAVADELKFQIESHVSKRATVLVIKAKSWGIASPS